MRSLQFQLNMLEITGMFSLLTIIHGQFAQFLIHVLLLTTRVDIE